MKRLIYKKLGLNWLKLRCIFLDKKIFYRRLVGFYLTLRQTYLKQIVTNKDLRKSIKLSNQIHYFR